MRGTIRKRLTLFFALAVVVVGFTGMRYAQIGDVFLDTRYTVTADLPTSGGLFSGAEVTYRGVPVGRVVSVELAPDGVTAELAIRNRWKVPADVVAHVRNRSAVGEQYVDLVPNTSGAPYLGDGSRLDRAQTTTPLQEEQLIKTLDSFVQSVDTDDMRTVVTELGKVFRSSGSDLERLLDGTDTLLTAANEHLPQTLSLLDNTTTVLRTQQAGASDIRLFADSLARVTGTLRTNDKALRTVLASGPGAARELTGLVNQLSLTMPVLLRDLVILARLTTPRLGGLATALAMLPYDVAAVQAVVRNGRTYLGLSLNQQPGVCQKGYLPPPQWRSTNDLSVVPPPNRVHCAEPGLNWRGSAHAP